MPAKADKTEPAMTFESAVQRLEALVREMEDDTIPLTDLLVRYEEGTKLAQFCQAQLDVAEKRVEIIKRNAKGEAQLAPFEPGAAEPVEKAAPPRKDEVSLF